MWVLILIVAIVVISVVWAIASPFVEKGKERKLQASFTECTVGILRETGRTGRYINEQPELLMVFDAVVESGDTVPVVVTEVISMTELHKLEPGMFFAIRYSSESRRGVLDKAPDAERTQDLYDRYKAKHDPRGFTYEQLCALRERGVKYKAVLTDLRLTGDEDETGCEVQLTVRIDQKDGEARVLRRTSWKTNAELAELVVGKTLDIEVVEDSEPWFAVLQDVGMIGAALEE